MSSDSSRNSSNNSDVQEALQDYVDLMFTDETPVNKTNELSQASGTQAKQSLAVNSESAGFTKKVEECSEDVKASSEEPAPDELPPTKLQLKTETHRARTQRTEVLEVKRSLQDDSVDWQLIRERVKKLTQRMPQATPPKPKPKSAEEGDNGPKAVAMEVGESQAQSGQENKTRRRITQAQKKNDQIPLSSSVNVSSTPISAVEKEHATEPTKTKVSIEWAENGRPVWAQEPFEALLFNVSGLTMAVPLAELGSIYPVTEDLTPIFGQIEWLIGLLPINGTNIRTVNTAKVVMPERYESGFVESFRYVISISGHDWGLAVDSVDKAITLEPSAVRWRTARSKRAWLAGTVVDYMCALVDVKVMAQLFEEADNRIRH